MEQGRLGGRPAPAKNAWNALPGGAPRAAACDVLDGPSGVKALISLQICG